MKTTLGTLLQRIQVLDEAAAQAPLNRNQTMTVVKTTQALQSEIQEVYGIAKANTEAVATKELTTLRHNITELLPETSEPLRSKLAALLPVSGSQKPEAAAPAQS